MKYYINEFSPKDFCMNLYFLMRMNIKEMLIEQRQATVFNGILAAAAISKEYAEKYKKEIQHLLETGGFTFYPSRQIAKYDASQIEGGLDNSNGLPFVMHHGKRLYYPKNYSVEKAKKTYYEIATYDAILGKEANGSAHQYQSENYFLPKGGVIVDVGCAEALFALDNMETADKAILIERNQDWIKALQATFAPYGDKVKIVNKLVSGEDTKSTITLQTLIGQEDKPVFVKMDIEGYEVETIRSARKLLEQKANITLSCCTYHNNNDAAQLENLFNEMGYTIEYSDGYMLFTRYDQPKYPFFRHGLIRAKKA
jgi:hypothetical protein